MADVTSSQPVTEDTSEYEAIADQLLVEMKLLEAKMQRDRVEIDRLKAETNLLKLESARLEAEIRATLTCLSAMV